MHVWQSVRIPQKALSNVKIEHTAVESYTDEPIETKTNTNEPVEVSKLNGDFEASISSFWWPNNNK